MAAAGRDDEPPWEEIHRRLVDGGTFPRIPNPSAAHLAREGPEPRVRARLERPLAPVGR